MVLGGGTIRKIFILVLFSISLIILTILSNKPNDLLILVNNENPIENYNPRLGTFRNFYVAKELIEPLKKLEKDLRGLDIIFEIEKAYVSVKMQEKIFESKVKEYQNHGLSEMNAKMETAKTILVSRYCEHHTGLSIDFKGDSRLYNYLEKNAHKYGFILRYPKGKEEITKYEYDKNHYRYVGVENATKIYELNLSLEEYLKEA